MSADNFVARLAQAKLATKADIVVDIVKETYFDEKSININKKVTLIKKKHVVAQNELKEQQDIITRLQTFDSSLFIGQS